MGLFAEARRTRASFLASEVAAQRRLASAYARAYGDATREIASLAAKMADARRRGEPITRSWVFRSDRLARVRDQLALATERFAGSASLLVAGAQDAAIRAAADHALALMEAGSGTPAGTFAYANLGAVRSFVGRSGDGTPLRETLIGYGLEAGARIEGELLRGIALGENPRSVGRRMRDAAGMPGARAATVARTEILRSYNAASLDVYRANSDAVEGWRWLAALDRRTCAVCWAMHGTTYPLSEPFGSHPNCRCTTVPTLIGEKARVETGEQIFARQPPGVMRDVLGPKALAAYESGEIVLGDLVERSSTAWGPTLSRRSLANATQVSPAQAAG